MLMHSDQHQLIYIPFPVTQINGKGINLDFDADFRVVYFSSNLVDNAPFGCGFGGIFSDYSSATQMIGFIFQQPRDLNTTFNLKYNVIDIESCQFPKGLNSNETMFNATTNVGGVGLDGTTAGTVPA